MAGLNEQLDGLDGERPAESVGRGSKGAEAIAIDRPKAGLESGQSSAVDDYGESLNESCDGNCGNRGFCDLGAIEKVADEACRHERQVHGEKHHIRARTGFERRTDAGEGAQAGLGRAGLGGIVGQGGSEDGEIAR